MQDITPIIPQGKKQIASYGAGGFNISGEKFSGSIFLSTDKVVAINISSVSDFSEELLNKLDTDFFQAEILLVGYGTKSEFLPAKIEKFFRDKKKSIEYMNTGAACRTYNVLLSEGRNVAAILVAV